MRKKHKIVKKRLKPRIFGDLVASHSLSLSLSIYIYTYICLYVNICIYIHIHTHLYNQEFVGSGFQMMQQYNGFRMFSVTKKTNKITNTSAISPQNQSVFYDVFMQGSHSLEKPW